MKRRKCDRKKRRDWIKMDNAIKKVKTVFHFISFNWKVLAGFEIIYKLACTLVFLPAFAGLFQLIMRIRGYYYLTLENLFAFLVHPLTLIPLLFLIVFMTVCSMLDIMAVIFILDQSAQGVHVHLIQVVRFTLSNGARVPRRQNLMLPLMVLFLIPFLNIGVAPNLINSISIPEFITKFIAKNRVLTVLALGVLLALSRLLMQWLYALHYFTLENCTFREAQQKSARLSRKRKWKSYFTLLLVQGTISLCHWAFLLAGTFIIMSLGKFFRKFLMINAPASSMVWLLITVSALIAGSFSTPLSYGAVSVLFYRWKKEDQEQIIHSKAPAYTGNRIYQRRIHTANVVCCAILLAAAMLLVYGWHTGRINPQIEYMRTMQVTAHRGASVRYPENTMAAFQAAKELGADWIELDVQQSADGQLFVMHDKNFRRTTGLNANSWELTYDEISRLDAGSFFGREFAGEKIPLLSDVIAFARANNIRLNIELKPTGHETDFAESVARMILEEGFENNCVVTSMAYHVLERVKAYSEDITTVYVMSFAYGSIDRLTAADHFSIEASSVSKKLVSRLHNAGKELYAWTVNSERSINRMIDLNVDNIITDDISLAKECIYSNKLSPAMDDFMENLETAAETGS